MAKLTTTQPIPIGTATGRSDHRTNTAQIQQTTTLRSVVLILILLVLTGSYAGLWALRFVLEQRTDTE